MDDYEDPIELTPENYKFFDRFGREVNISSWEYENLVFEIRNLINAFLYRKAKENK